MSGPSEAITVEKIRAATEIAKAAQGIINKTALQLEAEEYLRQQLSGGKVQPPLGGAVEFDKTQLEAAVKRGFSGLLKGETGIGIDPAEGGDKTS